MNTADRMGLADGFSVIAAGIAGGGIVRAQRLRDFGGALSASQPDDKAEAEVPQRFGDFFVETFGGKAGIELALPPRESHDPFPFEE